MFRLGDLDPPRSFLTLRRPAEPNVVANDRARSDGKRLRIGDVELLEPDFVLPHLPQEILDDLDRKLLAGTATVSKTEGREAGIVAYGQRLAVDDAVDRAEPTIIHDGFSAVLDFECLSVEGTLGKADLFTFGFVDLVTCRHAVVAIGVELLRILPMPWVEACGFMRGDHVAMPFIRRRSHFFEGRYAAAVRRDCSK